MDKITKIEKIEAGQRGIVKFSETFIGTAIGMVIAWSFIIGSIVFVGMIDTIKNKKLSF